MERHGRLNLHCLPQSYSLRGSFFHYLHDTFGKDALLQLAYSEEELTTALFHTVFGREFDALEQAWREQTVTAFSATAQVSQLARDYREQIKGFDHGAGHPLPLLCNAKASNY